MSGFLIGLIFLTLEIYSSMAPRATWPTSAVAGHQLGSCAVQANRCSGRAGCTQCSGWPTAERRSSASASPVAGS